jgi:beta-glucosidase
MPKAKKTSYNPYVNDLNWEIYPKGIVESAEYLYKYTKLPIYITESGTCSLNDDFRCKYIYDHIMEINSSELPIVRYYHWCFCDNFEWAEGEHARFGIVHVDFKTQERTIKKSGYFYKELIENGLSNELYEKYVVDEKYKQLFKK